MTQAIKKWPAFLVIPFVMVFILGIIHILKTYYWPEWIYYGLVPRQADGLRGILFSPLLHSDIKHLFSNSSSLLLIMMALLYFYKRAAWPAFTTIYFITGISVWLTARDSIHIGASGVLFGLISFVLFSGIFRRNPRAIALSFAVLFAFGGIFTGLAPGKDGVSWESHLAGFIVGIFTAFIFRSMVEEDEEGRKPVWAEGRDSETERNFLPQDIFDKTKQERFLERQQRDSSWTRDIS